MSRRMKTQEMSIGKMLGRGWKKKKLMDLLYRRNVLKKTDS